MGRRSPRTFRAAVFPARHIEKLIVETGIPYSDIPVSTYKISIIY